MVKNRLKMEQEKRRLQKKGNSGGGRGGKGGGRGKGGSGRGGKRK